MYSETKKEKAEKEIILPIQIPQNNLDNFPNLMMFYEHDHKFIFEKNPELLNDLQHHIQKYLSNENKYFFIHRSFPEKILKDLIYLKEYQKNISEKEENYNLMLKNYTILTQQISNQDSIIKQIENTYIDKINDLKIELAEFKEKLERIHEEKHTFKEKLRKEKFELAQKLDYETEVRIIIFFNL